MFADTGQRAMTPESDILTLDELHTYLKIPKPTLYSLAQNGRIPAAKIGKHWRFRKAVIDEWLTTQQGSPSPRRSRPQKVVHANA